MNTRPKCGFRCRSWSSGVTVPRLAVLFVGIVLAGALASCRNGGTPRPAPQAPAHEIDWVGIREFAEWGETGDGIFGTSTKDELETWRWDEEVLKKNLVVQLPNVIWFVALPADLYLACVEPIRPMAPWPLVLASADSNEAIRTWDPPSGWHYWHTGASVNRRFTCVVLKEEVVTWDTPQHRLGLVDLRTKELTWVSELNGQGSFTVRQIAVSDDGQFIAVGGWNNGTALVDTVNHKVLWSKKPPQSVSIGYVTFSSDGATLYEADAGGGCVYVVETTTGNIVARRYATESGQAIYGHRISCLAVSPDGAWMAAGTGPEGQVYLFPTTLSAKPIILPHGMSTILVVSFSPDSRHLASLAGGKIKIWAVPASKSPTSKPATLSQSGSNMSAVLRSGPEEGSRQQDGG